MKTINQVHNKLLCIDSSTDFLKEVRLLEHDYMSEMEDDGPKQVVDSYALQCIESIQDGVDHYRDLMASMMKYVARYRKVGGMMLLSESVNTYSASPWSPPRTNISANRLHEDVLAQVSDDPCADTFGVTHVIYAFRLKSRGQPLVVYAVELSGVVVMHVLDKGVWHRLEPIDAVIELAIRCAADQMALLNFGSFFLDSDHAELKQAHAEHPVLYPILCEMDMRERNMLSEIDAREAASQILARFSVR